MFSIVPIGKVFEFLHSLRRVHELWRSSDAAATPDIEELDFLLDGRNWSLLSELFHQSYFSFRPQVALGVLYLKAISCQLLAFRLEAAFVHVDTEQF